MDLDKLIYEMLKEGKSVKEISDATLNAQKKISEEQKSEELIADCRADLVDATIAYLKALGLESFFERAIEYLDDWLFNVGGLGACMDYKDIKEILDILKEVE